MRYLYTAAILFAHTAFASSEMRAYLNGMTFLKQPVLVDSVYLTEKVTIVTNSRICEPCVNNLYDVILALHQDIGICHLQIWNPSFDTMSNLMSMHQRLFNVNDKIILTGDLTNGLSSKKLASFPSPFILSVLEDSICMIEYDSIFRKSRFADSTQVRKIVKSVLE